MSELLASAVDTFESFAALLAGLAAGLSGWVACKVGCLQHEIKGRDTPSFSEVSVQFIEHSRIDT